MSYIVVDPVDDINNDEDILDEIDIEGEFIFILFHYFNFF